MLKKTMALILATFTLLSLFAYLNVVEVFAMDESEIYGYLDDLSVKVYDLDSNNETCYMRSDQWANPSTYYKLNATRTATTVSKQISVWADSSNYLGIRVFKRSNAGTETEFTSGEGNEVAKVYGPSTGLLSATWACSSHSLEATDSIVVKVYAYDYDIGYTLKATFMTEQLNAVSLDSAVWTVYYYVVSTSGLYYYRFGISTYDSKITNFLCTQWFYRETRDFQYNSNWWAKKLHYGYGLVWNPTLKPNSKFYNETDVTAYCLTVGFEGAPEGLDCSYADIIISIVGNLATNGEKMHFIDAFLAGASPFRLQVMYQGNVIFDYPNDKQKYAQQLGWCFYDTLFPEYTIPSAGEWAPYYDDETSKNQTPAHPSVGFFASSLWMKVYNFNATEQICTRAYFENPSVNTNKWWLKWFTYFTYNCSTYYYEKVVIGCSDFNEDKADKESLVSFVMVLCYFHNKQTGYGKYEIEMVQTTGGLKRGLLYKTLAEDWVLAWSYMTDTGFPYGYNLILEEGSF